MRCGHNYKMQQSGSQGTFPLITRAVYVYARQRSSLSKMERSEQIYNGCNFHLRSDKAFHQQPAQCKSERISRFSQSIASQILATDVVDMHAFMKAIMFTIYYTMRHFLAKSWTLCVNKLTLSCTWSDRIATGGWPKERRRDRKPDRFLRFVGC